MAFSAAPRLSCASMRFRYCSTSDRQVSDPPRKAVLNLRDRRLFDLEWRWRLRCESGDDEGC
jgi:hypothetical protein